MTYAAIVQNQSTSASFNVLNKSTELSMLRCSQSALLLAQDSKLALKDRLSFLCLSGTRLDKFFEMQMGLIQTQNRLDCPASEQIALGDLVAIIHVQVLQLVEHQSKLLKNLLRQMRDNNDIGILYQKQWNESQKVWLQSYFVNTLLPVLSPVGLDSTHPFPRIQNKSLCFIVSLNGQDAFGRHDGNAVIQMPLSFPSLIELPTETPHKKQYVFISTLIQCFANELFNGLTVEGIYQFRVTRNCHVKRGDIINFKTDRNRRSDNFGDIIRLEVEDACPESLLAYLCEKANVTLDCTYLSPAPLDLTRYNEICDNLVNTEGQLTYSNLLNFRKMFNGVNNFRINLTKFISRQIIKINRSNTNSRFRSS